MSVFAEIAVKQFARNKTVKSQFADIHQKTVGDDFGDGGGDSHVRIGGIDYVEITDYTKLPEKLAYLLGDANLDGQITAADARIILRISAKLDNLEDKNITVEVIDVNFDGTVTASDARTVLRVAAKLESMPEKAN